MSKIIIFLFFSDSFKLSSVSQEDSLFSREYRDHIVELVTKLSRKLCELEWNKEEQAKAAVGAHSAQAKLAEPEQNQGLFGFIGKALSALSGETFEDGISGLDGIKHRTKKEEFAKAQNLINSSLNNLSSIFGISSSGLESIISNQKRSFIDKNQSLGQVGLNRKFMLLLLLC